MSFETPEQKQCLQKLQEISALCAEHQVQYGKALAAFNLGYGRNSNTRIRTKAQRAEILAKTKASVLRAKATVLSRMTGQQVRLAKLFPENMLIKVGDDQMIGEVFTIKQIEKAL